MSLTFTADDTEDDAPDAPAIVGRRGRRPGRPDDVVIQLRPDHQTVTVLDPWRVVDHGGTAYMPGDIATVPEALADEWVRNHWATRIGEE